MSITRNILNHPLNVGFLHPVRGSSTDLSLLRSDDDTERSDDDTNSSDDDTDNSADLDSLRPQIWNMFHGFQKW